MKKIPVIAAVVAVLVTCAPLCAQDIPGVEICTVEKTMERRTGCLQSNVEFLQKTLTKLTTDTQLRMNAAKAQIDALRAQTATLQKTVEDLQAGQNKLADDMKKKTAASPAKDVAPAPKK